ncbi:MAG TPA: hypothetical protein VFO55_12765 [Gemmatimonadaceae bacterium]|nr:hypothetical protein [Gemmatimonadaceae bacterium]
MKNNVEGHVGRAALALCAGLLVACSSKGDGPITDPVVEQTVQPPGANFSCPTSQVAELAVGDVRTALPGTFLCLKSSANAEYMLNGFFASTVPTAQTQVSVTGFGITTVSSSASTSLTVPRAMTTLDGSTPRESIELAFRNYERNVLAPRMAGARLAYRNRASFNAAPPAVGDLLQLNASSTGCESPRYRFGRVAAVTNRAIVVSDTGNPAGGFTDAEYASIGATFDTLVDPLDRAAFGDPTDIDANGRVIIFYTRVVNELTPAQSPGVVEGFFNPRDLFPRTATPTLQACTGSNVAEMFYMVVADPGGTINGNVRTKSDVQRSTISVIAHEYQHLINSARRIYVNNADDFEEVWLNEGLSHIAEELLFYHTSGLASRSNIDATTITASQRRVDAFNLHQVANFGRYNQFLARPELSSPYANNDSLSNRGAIWSFLRYAADRKAASDGTFWQALVNSRTVGIPNLNAVLGTDVMPWFRDWSISVYTDDRAPTAATWQQPSWHFRSIYPRLGITTFPLRLRPLTNASATAVTLSGGGSMYATFGVSAGTTAGLSWTAGSPSAVFSIVRTR